MKRHTVLFLIFFSTIVRADSWQILHDNDMLFDSDDHYSAGVQISWMSDSFEGNSSKESPYVEFLSDTAEKLGVSLDGRNRSGSISIQELIITPNDLKQSEPIYNDVPYIGLLSSSFSLLSWDDDDIDEYSLTIGLLGPHSGAEQLQKTVHKIVGSTEPQGWDNQLGTKMIVQIGHMHGVKHYIQEYNEARRFEWLNSYYVDIGNFYTGLGLGSAVRYGENIPSNFASTTGLLIGGKSNMIELDRKNASFGWDIHGGVYFNAIGYFYLYKESERLGYEFDNPRLLPIVNAGATFYWKNVSLGLDIFPSGTTATNPRAASFARMSLIWSFE